MLFAMLTGACAWAVAAGDGGPETQPRVAIAPRRPESASQSALSNLRLNVRMVLVPVTVTDPLDRPVTTLSRDSFRILEDGVEQTIASFSQEDAPVSLGLLFDTSGSMKNRLAASVEALRLIFQTTLPGDEFFVVQFSDRARLLGGFTAQPEEIHYRLGAMEAKGWTALLDAIVLGTHQMRSARNQRRALLILSDGNDNNSRFSGSEVRNIVIEGDLRIFGVNLFQRSKLLQQLAEETGGEVLVAQNLNDLPDLMERLSRNLRTQYLLGYSTHNPHNDGKYRKVKIEVLPPPGFPRLHASWRRGYYAPIE